jgi:hypothetical protein
MVYNVNQKLIKTLDHIGGAIVSVLPSSVVDHEFVIIMDINFS